MNETPKSKRGWRILRRILITLAVLATLIAILYAEEDWRGKRAWEKCKAELEAKGVVLDWDKFIPPPVPDDQNFFTASTNILLRFKKAGAGAESELATKNLWLRIDYSTNCFAVFDTAKTGPLVVAEMAVEPSNVASAAAGKSQSYIAKLGAAGAREQLQDLIRTTIGRGISGAAGFQFSERQLTNLAPAQIVLQSDTVPSVADLQNLIPENLATNIGHLRIEAVGDHKSFRVLLTGVRITAAADYLKWSDQFIPALDEIREALKRPYATIPGDYSQPLFQPMPNFITLRVVAQLLVQRAQCEFLIGQSDQALHELTLVHDLCRILEHRPTGQPITLVEAMINVAITGLYVNTVAEGFRSHAWQEPQLKAIQSQMETVRLLPFVAEASRESQAHAINFTTRQNLKKYFSGEMYAASGMQVKFWDKVKGQAVVFIPQGWIYQNLKSTVELEQKWVDCFDPTNEQVFPSRLDKANSEISHALSHYSPFRIIASIFIPSFIRAMQTCAFDQTMANEAQIVCALERYRLAHGEYPETLDALAPQFIEKLPHDIIGGGPLHYRRASDGRFLLYSIGWNETDNSGEPSPPVKVGPIDYTQGDWVWQYPMR